MSKYVIFGIIIIVILMVFTSESFDSTDFIYKNYPFLKNLDKKPLIVDKKPLIVNK